MAGATVAGMVRLEAGDLVLVKGRGWIAGLIRRFSGPSWGMPAVVNHVAVATSSRQVVETGARVRVVDPEYYRGSEVAVLRPRVNRVAKAFIAEYARGYVGRGYGWGKLVAHLADWLIGGAYVFRRLAGSQRYPICSWVAAWSYEEVGVEFGVPPGDADPDDIWRWGSTHPREFLVVSGISKW